MALNRKNLEVERLALEAADFAGRRRPSHQERVLDVLAQFRQQFPSADFGRKMTKAEKEQIPGYGPDGS